MPLHQLSVAPADVSGAGLCLALNAPAPKPLAALTLEHPAGGGALRLGVLGASHVVAVEGVDSPFSEQISCDVHQHGAALPERWDAPGYRLTAHSHEHGEAEFRLLAEELRANCANDAGWLGGAFPGDSAALTAIAAAPDGVGWRWRTWHLYPASSGGSVVYTESRWCPWSP